MDPKETSKPIRSARRVDAVASTSSASSASTKPPARISRERRSSNVIDLRQPAIKPTPKAQQASKPKAGKVEAAESVAPKPARNAKKRRFWPALGRFILLLLVLAALMAGAYFVYITYYRT